MATDTNEQPLPKVRFGLSPKQSEAFRRLLSKSVRELLYGGAKNGGKTVLFCIWFYVASKIIGQEFGLGRSENPPVVGFMGRKRAVDFSNTTLRTWCREIPTGAYRLIESKHLIRIEDRVDLAYGGLDDENTIQKFNSAEYMMIGIDQAEECEREEVATLRASLRLTLGETGKRRQPSFGFKALWTANPAQCWLKDDFITRQTMGQEFIRALPADNPWKTHDYEETIRRAYGHSPSLIAAYLDGSWDNVGDPETLIDYEWISAAVERGKKDRPLDPIVLKGNDPVQVASKVMWAMKEWGAKAAYIDEIGIGAGVYAVLKANGVPCYGVNVGAESNNPEKFVRLRDEIWWVARESLNPENRKAQAHSKDLILGVDVAWKGNDSSVIMPVRLPIALPDCPDLISDLASVHWAPQPNGGRIKIEPKEDMRERIGRSPDHGDAYCLAVYGHLGTLEPTIAWNTGTAIGAQSTRSSVGAGGLWYR